MVHVGGFCNVLFVLIDLFGIWCDVLYVWLYCFLIDIVHDMYDCNVCYTLANPWHCIWSSIYSIITAIITYINWDVLYTWFTISQLFQLYSIYSRYQFNPTLCAIYSRFVVSSHVYQFQLSIIFKMCLIATLFRAL